MFTVWKWKHGKRIKGPAHCGNSFWRLHSVKKFTLVCNNWCFNPDSNVLKKYEAWRSLTFLQEFGQGPKTSLKALTVIIKPEANFVSLVEGEQLQQNWVWNSIQEYKVTICDRSERSRYKEVFRWEPAIFLSLFLVMRLSKSHSSWLCNSTEWGNVSKYLTQHKRQPQAKTKYLEYICYWSKQAILIMKRKKPALWPR